MSESIVPSVPAPATLPSSAASTPTAAQSGAYFAHPCDGPNSYMASAGTHNSAHIDAPGSSLAPSRMRSQTAVHHAPVAVPAAPPQQHPMLSSVQEHTVGWHHSTAQIREDSVASGAPQHDAAAVNIELWSPQQHSSSSSGGPWIQQDQLAALQQRGLPGSQPFLAAPFAAQQAYTRQQQQQLDSPTWQQQQQGWSYNMINGDSRPRSHSPRARRRQHQPRTRPHSSNAGMYPQQQQWQQQQQQPPVGQQPLPQQHTLHPHAPEALQPQPASFQPQQPAAAASAWQGQGLESVYSPPLVAPPPPPPIQGRHRLSQQQNLWRRPNSIRSRWDSDVAETGAVVQQHDYWAIAGRRSRWDPDVADTGAVSASDSRNSRRHAAAAVAAPNPGLQFLAAAPAAHSAVASVWPVAVAQQQPQQHQQVEVQSHRLSHVESDSDEAEEWYSMTHSPLPPDAQQQQHHHQQQRGNHAASSSRWRPPTPYSPSATEVPEQHGAAVPSGQQAATAGQVGPNATPLPAHSGAGGSSSVAADVGGVVADSSDDDFEEAMPDLISDGPEGVSRSTGPGTTGQVQDSSTAADATAAAWGLNPQQQLAGQPAAAWSQQQEHQEQQLGMLGPEALLHDPLAPPAAAAAGSQLLRGVHPAQWRRHPLGSIDELQPDSWMHDAAVDQPMVPVAAAAAGGVEGVAAAAAAAVGPGEHPEWLMRFLDDAAQQQHRWQAQLSRRRSAAAAAWRTAELSRLTEETAALLAAGAVADDDVDSTAATAAGSSLDGYPGAAGSVAPFAAAAAELPQLARVRTAATPARTGAALDDSPNAQLVQLMQQWQHRYGAVQQEHISTAQAWQQQDLQQQREYALRRYGVLTPSRQPVSRSDSSHVAAAAVQDLAVGDDSSNPTAAGAPYRPLQAAAASGPAGNSSGGDAENQLRAAAADGALLQQLLESATRSSQDVDASALAAMASSWQQQQRQQWQQRRATQGPGAVLQGNHSPLPVADVLAEMMQNTAGGGVPGGSARVSDVGSSAMRASFESSSWQDGMPPLLDAEPDSEGFDGLTPTISPPQSFTMHPSSNLTANTSAGQNPGTRQGVNPHNNASHAQQSFAGAAGFGIGSPPFVGWDGSVANNNQVVVDGSVASQVVVDGFGSVNPLLLPQYRNMAPAAAAVEGTNFLQQQQQLQQQQMMTMMPPPLPLVRGRWSSSSSIPSPLMSPAVLMPTGPGQSAAAALRTPIASGILDQEFVTPQAAGILQQQQPPRLRPPRQQEQQQQQQWPPSPAPGWGGGAAAVGGGTLTGMVPMPGRYGPYTADSSHAAAAAAATASASAAGHMTGNVPNPIFTPLPMFTPGMVGFTSGSWQQQQQQQQQGMAAAVDPRSVIRLSGVRQHMQGVAGNPAANRPLHTNLMPGRHRSPASDQAAAANIAAAGAAAAAAASATGTSIWSTDGAGDRSQEHQQWLEQITRWQHEDDYYPFNQLAAASPSATAAARHAATAAAARRRHIELQQQMLAARGGLQLPGGRGRSRVLGSGGLSGAGPDVMLRMMRMMGLEEPLDLEFARMFGAGDGMSYEQLIGLEDVRVVVPDHVLAQLPRRSVPPPPPPDKVATAAADGTAAEAESVICTVCQCDLAGSEPVVQLPCKHDYHESCICEWLSKYKKTCPVCKAEVK